MIRLALACGLVVSWVPLILDRYRLWRARGNPMTLATCLLILLAAYLPVWIVAGPSDPWSWLGVVVVDSLVCGFFYAALAWSRKKFPGGRQQNGERR
jgi:hypothetical protein